jgi:S-DNA-T family DNA segregation ATPase FtsK/SpoIIIE
VYRFGRWVTAAEFAPVIGEAVGGAKWVEAKDHTLERGKVARDRFKRAVWIGAGAGAALAAGSVYYGEVVPVGAGLVVFAAAVAAGWKAAPGPILDPPEGDPRQDLNLGYINDALRAAGLLRPAKGDEPAPSVQLVAPILRDGDGWAALFDLPRGGGKTAADVIGKREVVAAELGVDEIQLHLGRVRATAGGHAGRLSMWVSDDDPYIGPPVGSPLAEAASWSMWDAIPFGRDARGRRIELSLMWQSIFFGGLPRRGKTAAQRLVVAAGVLDPWVRIYGADGKGGGDWRALEAVAHRFVRGVDAGGLAAFLAMVDEVIADMDRAFERIAELPVTICPQSKITPEISRRYRLFVTLVVIDELQEYLAALPKDERETLIDKLCRIARRGPAAGFIPVAASQRPDADSVPTKLREIISYRYCTQVIDRTSSDMVLGKGRASQGADASALSEAHVGVGVLATGPDGFTIVKTDFLDGPPFTEICARGRRLREKAATLSGDAAGVLATAMSAAAAIPAILLDTIEVIRHEDRQHTDTILFRLAELDDKYAGYDSDRLAAELKAAGVNRTGTQVKVGDVNRNGYRRADLEAALPLDYLSG